MGEKLLRDFLMLWATVDPIGTAALFLPLTAALTPAQRRGVALRATLYAAIILLACMAFGQVILNGMGVRVLSLQVAGGIILFLFGLQMIFVEPAKLEAAAEAGHDIAVFPLAIPSIASPGAIMAVIVLTDNDTFSIGQQLGTAAVLVTVLGITLGFMLAGQAVMGRLGKNGAAVVIKVMGMLLAALSVELFMTALGVKPWGK